MRIDDVHSVVDCGDNRPALPLVLTGCSVGVARSSSRCPVISDPNRDADRGLPHGPSTGHGTLELKGSRVGPSSVSVPTLAVVNVADDVAPLGSIEPFINAMPTKDARIIEYAGELGVCLQHLGILILRKAWPEIVSWLKSRP